MKPSTRACRARPSTPAWWIGCCRSRRCPRGSWNIARTRARLRLPSEEGPQPAKVPPTASDAGRKRAARSARPSAHPHRAGLLLLQAGDDRAAHLAADAGERRGDAAEEYLTFLRTHPGEAGALQQDLLISVTNFFRDRDAFDALEAEIPAIFARQRHRATSCASGRRAAPPARKPIPSPCCCWSRPGGWRRRRRSRCLPPIWTKASSPRRATACIPSRSRPMFPRNGCGASSCRSTAATGRGASCANACSSPCTTCCRTRRFPGSIFSPAGTCSST